MPSPLQVIVGDTHAGGLTALSTPEFRLSDGQTVIASQGQRWLWDNWLDFLDRVKAARKPGQKVVGIHLGDAIDGNKHRTVQAIPTLFDQEEAALDVLGPLRALCDSWYMVRGTEAHDGEGAQSISRIAGHLNADGVGWEFWLRIGGVLCYYTHHGRTGGRPWTTGAANVAAEIMLACAERGEPVPQLAFTGHRHRIDDSGSKFRNIRVVSAPAWQLATSFAYRVGAAFTPAHIGGVLVEEENVEIVRYQAPRGSAVVSIPD